jgi:hypothetical protein
VVRHDNLVKISERVLAVIESRRSLDLLDLGSEFSASRTVGNSGDIDSQSQI